MDHEQRDVAARVQDSEITARIVRNIADIERDFHFASGPLSERLMREMIQSIVKAADNHWIVVEKEPSAFITTPDWKVNGVGNGDMWLELSEICQDELDYSWIAVAVRGGRTQLTLELMFRRGLADAAETMIRNDKAVAALVKLGFVRDQDEPRLFLPIHIQAEALAIGLEQNDLAEALAPIGRAVTVATTAIAELNKLIEQVRTSGKRR